MTLRAMVRLDAGPDHAARVTAFVGMFADHPPRALIGNLTTRVEAFELAGRPVPMTLNDRGDVGNCYICRPSAAYVDYALDETRHFRAAPVLRWCLRGLIRTAAPLVRASGLDHQVQVNNWLLSTNPVPHLDRSDVADMRDALVDRHPGRAIVMRSVNDIADPGTMAALRAEGFVLLASRQVYVFDDRSAAPQLTRDMRRDRRALADTRLERVGEGGFAERDYDRSADLYRMLYLEKYTPLNPQYTSLFLREMHRVEILRMVGLRDPDTGDLVAVTAMFESGSTLTQPIVGYDTTRPQSEGLYRMMMALSQQEATARGLFFNMSAGAAGFKRSRGAVPAVEYTAVYVRHLGPVRRAAVGAMRRLLDGIGVPMLLRFEL